MRCSAAGWVANDLRQAEALGVVTAQPTHNHPYAMNAAGTVAGLIYLARTGATKEELREYVESRGYEVPSLGRLKYQYEYTESSQGTMPAVLSAFFYGNSFEDCIRKAVSIGGDSDTIAAITGSIAEAHYGIPDAIRTKAWDYLPEHLRQVILDFNSTFVNN